MYGLAGRELDERVGIIDQGRLVAEGTRRELVATVGERNRIDWPPPATWPAWPRPRPAWAGSTRPGWSSAGSTWSPGTAGHAGAEVTSVELVEPDLEAVFLHLTGKALRD